MPDAPTPAPYAERPSSLSDEVVDRLPYGIVVVSADGRVQSANAAAASLLWDIERGGPPAHCHEIFACRAPGGPCAAGCLAARAATSVTALPEIRIDSAGAGEVSALWVTAAPLSHERSAVLHLRAGDARDRRRRSDPHWLSGPELRITALGRTWVDSPESPLGGQWLQQKPGLLLKYLLVERNRVVHAEEIAEALWPAAGRQGLGTVRHFMHALRQKLEPGRARGALSSFVVTVQDGYAIDRRRVQIDADSFEEAADRGLVAARCGDGEGALGPLDEALTLYRGDLVADEPYAEWAMAERDRLRARAAAALRAVVAIRLEQADLDRAADGLERLATLEPYDVDTHRTLLAVWLAQGRRTEASRRYAAFKTRMAREFGEGPGFELSDARLAPRVA